MKKGIFALVALMVLLVSPLSEAKPRAKNLFSKYYLLMPEWKTPASFFSETYLLDVLHSDPQGKDHPHLPSMLPCEGEVTSEFGWRRLGRREKMHEGIDIAAPVGTSIVAPADGVVVFAGRKSGYGLTLIVAHGDELTTLFAHNSKLFVKEGDTVTKGQEISRVGMTGHSTGPHVHYEVHRHGEPVDPSAFL